MSYRTTNAVCPTCGGTRILADTPCPTCGREPETLRVVIPRWAEIGPLRPLVDWLLNAPRLHVVGVLAAIPLILPLPVIAIIYAARKASGMAARDWALSWGFIIVIALTNILVSSWIFSAAADGIVSAIFHWWQSLPDLLPTAEPPTVST